MQRLLVFIRFFIAIMILIFVMVLPETTPGYHLIQDFSSFLSQPLIVPAISPTTGDILIDNFEYWDSPYNHGWLQSEPAYPVYGFGMGYATIFNTVLDLQEGSRVLDIYRPSSVFLIGTPFERHAIQYRLFTPPNADGPEGKEGIDLSKFGIISFDFRASVGIEPWDIFQLDVIGEGKGELVIIRFIPLEPPAGAFQGPRNTLTNLYDFLARVKAFEADKLFQIDIQMGRSMLDGTWHSVWVDLMRDVEEAIIEAGLDPNEWGMERANAVRVSGRMFRLDNLFFRTGPSHMRPDYPEIFDMGPLYAQIFEPYRYLFTADYSGAGHPGDCCVEEDRIVDLMLDLDNFITDPNRIMKIWLQDSNVNGVILMDPNYLNPDHPSYGEPEPYYSSLLGRDFVIDINLPLFSDPNLRMGGPLAAEAIEQGTLGWNATIGGYGANGVQSFLLQPLPINPYDGMPTYMTAHYVATDAARAYGKPHFPPEVVFIFESAMYNAGVRLWPNMAALDYTPQYFEDLIVSLEVTNGVHSETSVFPISVVNYPVENYAPVVYDTDTQLVCCIGNDIEYIGEFIDPDCFIFSLSPNPATSHIPGFPINQNFRTDMASLHWGITINGMPSYQYGPWIDSLIDPCTGIISWVFKFEGTYRAVVSCTDDYGTTSFAEFNIYAFSRDTWLNHPPLITDGFPDPVIIRAGEEYIDHSPEIKVEDPDNDTIYASCNIGSCGRDVNGNFFWKFQSNFPGTYHGEIIFYDIRGGYAIMNFTVVVTPWWSY